MASLACVIGGSGYFASNLVKQLLARGHPVHATVRSLRDHDKISHLLRLQKEHDRLHLFECDLDQPETFATAFEGCEHIFHTAAPVPLSFAGDDGGFHDAQAVVDQVVQGAASVVEVAVRERDAGRCPLQRVVFTSSTSAVRAIGSDPPPVPHTEAVWNEASRLEDGGSSVYGYMKTRSERAFWEACATHDVSGAAVVPGFIIGPTLTQRDSLSIQWMAGWLPDLDPPGGRPKCPQNLVDVRDLATVHIEAALAPKADGQRFIACYPQLTREVDMMALLGRCAPPDEPAGVMFNTSKLSSELGVQLRPLEDSLQDGWASLAALPIAGSK